MVRLALRKAGVVEWLVKTVTALHAGAEMAVTIMEIISRVEDCHGMIGTAVCRQFSTHGAKSRRVAAEVTDLEIYIGS